MLEISDVNSVVMLLLPDISLIEEIPIEQSKNAAKAMWKADLSIVTFFTSQNSHFGIYELIGQLEVWSCWSHYQDSVRNSLHPCQSGNGL